MSERMVKCVKLGRELPGLGRAPVKGELGQRIFENVSRQAWELWNQQVVLLVNHYGLTLADPQAQEFLRQQMEEYFFGPHAAESTEITPQAPGGKGSPSKGGPAPRRK